MRLYSRLPPLLATSAESVFVADSYVADAICWQHHSVLKVFCEILDRLIYLYFQKNYEQMQALVEELKTRSEKVKLGKCQDS